MLIYLGNFFLFCNFEFRTFWEVVFRFFGEESMYVYKTLCSSLKYMNSKCWVSWILEISRDLFCEKKLRVKTCSRIAENFNIWKSHTILTNSCSSFLRSYRSNTDMYLWMTHHHWNAHGSCFNERYKHGRIQRGGERAIASRLKAHFPHKSSKKKFLTFFLEIDP